jgi:hypothetical protein
MWRATTVLVTALPKESEHLLAVAPDDFVDERKKIVATLRDAGRRDDAKAVAEIKKPSQIVLAVNRAARDRPEAAKRASKAAERLGKTQLAGKPDEYRALVVEMEEGSGLLSEVAVANLSKGSKASDAMRRRVADHIRGALSTKESRQLLARGSLTEEVEATGFDAFAGLTIPRARRSAKAKSSGGIDQAERARERALRTQISEAERALDEAERLVREVSRARDEAAGRLAELRAQRSSR